MIRSTSCLFGILFLFQSCINIYYKTSYSAEEFPAQQNGYIRVRTVDGEKFKVKWLEKEGDSIVSIKNTKRIFIDTADIRFTIVRDSVPDIIPFRRAVSCKGPFEVHTKDDVFEFVEIELDDRYLKGIKRKGKNTEEVKIALNQVSDIRVRNDAASFAVPALVVFIPATALLIYKLNEMLQNMEFMP